MLVKEHLEKLGVNFQIGDSSEVEINSSLSTEQQAQLNSDLGRYGIELHDDSQNLLVLRVKDAIREMVQRGENMPSVQLSEYLTKKLNYSYGHLTAIFSDVTSTSISHFLMLQRVERVKELILTNKFTLTEISYRLNYSSLAHLSNQFKKVTGLTPKKFKDIMQKRRTQRGETYP